MEWAFKLICFSIIYYNQQMIQFMNVLEKAGIQAVITGLASTITTGANLNVPVMGKVVPLYVFTGLAGGVASIANDLMHYLIKNEIHIAKKAQDEASLYLGAAIGAAAYYGVITFTNPQLTADMGSYIILATGAGAEIASSFTYNMIRG